MSWRPLISILLLVLASASVSGQESEAIGDYRSASDAEGTSSYRLSGIVSAESGRMALINGRGYSEGDWVGGARIESIDARSVRVRSDSGVVTVNLGSSAVWSRSAGTPVRVAQRGAPRPEPQSIPQPEPERPPAAGLVASYAPVDTGHHGPVQPGETLSEIAQRYLSDGMTRNQMMMAMFRANPEAFSGNINLLRAGAILNLPSRSEVLERTPATAGLEVAQHMNEWHGSTQRYARSADNANKENYGPVTVGEALSVIASQILPEGVTRNQMMMAMFRANPEAFNGNINLLRAGVILRIPNPVDLREQAPEMATAEVVRQFSQWRAGSPQQASLATAPKDDGGQVQSPILSAVQTTR